MSDQLEKIAEYDNGDKVWRTTCKCMGDDNLTFQVATDDEFPEVYLEVWMDCKSYYNVWDEPKWSRPFRSFWRRLTAAMRLFFKGGVEVEGAFIFRGEGHIDAFCDAIQTHKEILKNRHKETEFNVVNKSGKGEIDDNNES